MKKEKETVLSAIVIIAEMHNPTILHPSFLSSEGIVPKNWHPIGDLLCTPSFSTVTFNNKYSFLVDHNRLEIQNNQSGHRVEESEIAEIAKKYITKLEYTEYVAIGINFMFFAPHNSPEGFLCDNYLESNFKSKHIDKIKKINLEFEIDFKMSLLNLRFRAGEKKGIQGKEKGIIITTNIHRNLASDNKLKEALEILSDYKAHSADIQEIADDFLTGYMEKK